VLFDSYSEFAKARGERRPLDRGRFGAFMIKMGGRPTRERGRVIGEHMVDIQGFGRRAELISKGANGGDNRATGYQLGSLQQAREVFDPDCDWGIEAHE
jgi:hypothetical protein